MANRPTWVRRLLSTCTEWPPIGPDGSIILHVARAQRTRIPRTIRPSFSGEGVEKNSDQSLDLRSKTQATNSIAGLRRWYRISDTFPNTLVALERNMGLPMYFATAVGRTSIFAINIRVFVKSVNNFGTCCVNTGAGRIRL